jgi:hypothetical protein
MAMLRWIWCEIDYFRTLERHETTIKHSVNDGQKGLNLFPAVDQLNDNG